MSKFLVVSLIVFLHMVQIAQAASAGAGKDHSESAIAEVSASRGIPLNIEQTSSGIHINMSESALAAIGMTPALLQASFDQIRTKGISADEIRKVNEAILRGSDAEIEAMGLTRKKMILNLRLNEKVQEIEHMLGMNDIELKAKGISRIELIHQREDIQEVVNGYAVGRPTLPKHKTPFAVGFFHEWGSVLKDMQEREIGIHGAARSTAAPVPVALMDGATASSGVAPSRSRTLAGDSIAAVRNTRVEDLIAKDDGLNELTRAILGKNYDKVHLLLAANDPTNPKWDVNMPDGGGETPLLAAARNDDLEMMELLLANGAAASVNTIGHQGKTPLNEMLVGGIRAGVIMLLNAGADPNQLDLMGRTPLMVSLDTIGGSTKLDNHQKLRMAKLLLNHGAGHTINHISSNGYTALRNAAEADCSEVVEFLLMHGAKESVNIADIRGKTPLSYAVKGKNALRMIDDLLASGADPNIADLNKETPLTILCSENDRDEKNKIDMARKLLEKMRLDAINQITSKGFTALTYAVERPDPLVESTHIKLIRLLLDHGADPTIGEVTRGGSSLEFAVARRYNLIANALMYAQRDKPLAINVELPYGPPRLKDKNSHTLMHVIAQGDDTSDGTECRANMERLLSTTDGLKALSMKDENDKLPEALMPYADLKARMKSLRESYGLFSINLRRNIAKHADLLTKLESIATHITAQPIVSGAFSVMEWDKAQRILKDRPIAVKEAEITTKIFPLEDSVSKTIERLSQLIGDARTAKGPRAKDIKTQIETSCEDLKSEYMQIAKLTEEMPYLRSSLETEMRILRTKNNAIISAAINTFLPEDKKADSAAVSAAAAAVAVAEGGFISSSFDIETTALDVETLEAWMKASKTQQAAIKIRLDEKIAAGQAATAAKGETVSISENALKRYKQKVEHILQYAPEKLDPKVKGILESALRRDIPKKFIWSILRFAEDEALQKAHEAIEALNLSDAATFVPGSVHGSLITPGGKAPRGVGDGASTIGGDTWDGGSAIGSVLGSAARLKDFDGFEGIDVSKIGTGAGIDFEADTDRDLDEEPVLKRGKEIPVFVLPDTLEHHGASLEVSHKQNLETLQKLFDKSQWHTLSVDGSELNALFNTLGHRFSAHYNKDTFKITDAAAAAVMEDPKKATISVDRIHAADAKKHTGGPKARLLKGACKLLLNAGVTSKVIQAKYGMGITEDIEL